MTVLEKEDWRSVIGLVTNAKQVVTPVQDVGSKVAGYAKCWSVNRFFLWALLCSC